MCGIPKRLEIDVENQFNPYMPNPLLFVSPTDPKYETVDYFFKLNYEVPLSPVKSNLRRPTLPAIESGHTKTLEITPLGPPALSWINLGQPGSVPQERPFATEVPSATYHLMNLLKRQSGEEYSLKVVPEHYHLMNLKYLCTGVQSDAFQYDEDNVTFTPRLDGFTVGHFSVGTLIEMNKKFIEFGTCFKRLELASSVIPEALTMPVEGFVYKALSKAVNQSLFSVRHFIFNGPKDETIMQFSLRIRQFSRIIAFFAKLFKMHPNGEIGGQL